MNVSLAAPAAESKVAASRLMQWRHPPRRAAWMQWLRRTHGWVGLWGAALGLLFGISGIWLNHRNVLKLPPVAQQRSNTQIALPSPVPTDPQALARWLQQALQLEAPATSVRVEAARPVPWAERGSGAEGTEGREATLMQPERWTIGFGGPQATIQAEWWVGNHSVGVRRVENGLMGTLTNLHKGVGMSVPWILLVDTLAGSLILLSVSGLALWLLTHRRRLTGFAIAGSALTLTVAIAWSAV